MFSIHTKLHRSKTGQTCRSLRRVFSIHTKLHRSKTLSLPSPRGYGFSIHTKLHRSKTKGRVRNSSAEFSIHTKLHRSKTLVRKTILLHSLVSIRNYIALKQNIQFAVHRLRLVSIRNYIALKHQNASIAFAILFSIHTKLHRSKTPEL